MWTLYGSPGCGSAVVEVALEALGEEFNLVQANPWDPGPGLKALKRHNPLAQVPTLVDDDGAVISESAAIVLWLLERDAGHLLAPPPGDPARAQVHRWIVYLATNVYPALGAGDFPERWLDDETLHEALAEGAMHRVRQAWRVFASQLTPGTWLLGERFTILDAYAAMVSRWRPRRAWFEAELPELAACLARADAHPLIAPVWARHFAG